MGWFKKSEEERYFKWLERYRKTIPDTKNKVKMLDYFIDPEVGLLTSISNRTDGKTFGYTKGVYEICIEFDLKFFLICRHYTLRNVLFSNLVGIFEETDGLDASLLVPKRTDQYILVFYGSQMIALISDLNCATDLKLMSAFVKNFPIIIYDEFLALVEDYNPNEFEQIKTIYETVNRWKNIPLIKRPKIFLLGNAVNFDSPLLAGWNMFNILEAHPIDTCKKYGKIVLEMHYNEEANEDRETDLFDSATDSMSTGQFTFNKFNLASENDRTHIKSGGKRFYIKLDKMYLEVMYNLQQDKTILSVVQNCEEYEFCIRLSDKQEKTFLLRESFYSNTHYKKYEKGIFLFDNSFSKTYITNNERFASIKIMSCIRYFESLNIKDELDYKDELMEENYIEKTKKYIARKFEGW